MVFLCFLDNRGSFSVINFKNNLIVIVLYLWLSNLVVKKMFIFCNIIGMGIKFIGIFGKKFNIIIKVVIIVVWVRCLIVC